jgi:RNA polymerase sigma-70 factor (ECF subfamily)
MSGHSNEADGLKDGEVVRRVLAGDVELFGVLVGRCRREFGRYAAALAGDPDAAADAMQEALIRAYRSLARCRDPERFRAWFFRILTNQCHEARRRVVSVDLDRAELPARETADGPVETAELGAALEAALARLTPEQREAFLLKHVEGRSYQEMSELLGVGVDALKMRVHRARDALRAMLGDAS